ncbi:hypothetical protein EV11_0314 [Prochlorococcus sp. SS52]|nr:hypothetical protein EV04_0063 [Prochlorococcus marinus str. LG]KGG20234.1 hypothetical protein EV08_1126 [Prochlorococcus marinus str. SS2]KGG33094.1 hypothetical protein EV10_0820 [Prochlorococcus marinus str. SS51]KGG37205.1 hypothetical protein EV11_0314 [Prochlorococcus sp. SS52]
MLIVTNLIFYPAYSAEKITFYISILSRSITVEELENFSKRGVKSQFLKRVLKNQNEREIREILRKEYKAPIKLTSRLLYSKIGGVILKRVSKIIYPYRIPEESISIVALKAATIEAIAKGDETINIISFIKAYPSKVIAIDVSELLKVINKVESTNELVRFFSNAPLDKLKKDSN